MTQEPVSLQTISLQIILIKRNNFNLVQSCKQTKGMYDINIYSNWTEWQTKECSSLCECCNTK